ncbi:hypothetical protein VTL71DRAFT_8747 [Oculimacula yallundae]|uniref:Secreted protein n=1 Tax=Oculimacula yallundae TaxID=86028 RepID=A0ABR4CYK7_9HELO
MIRNNSFDPFALFLIVLITRIERVVDISRVPYKRPPIPPDSVGSTRSTDIKGTKTFVATEELSELLQRSASRNPHRRESTRLLTNPRPQYFDSLYLCRVP